MCILCFLYFEWVLFLSNSIICLVFFIFIWFNCIHYSFIQLELAVHLILLFIIKSNWLTCKLMNWWWTIIFQLIHHQFISWLMRQTKTIQQWIQFNWESPIWIVVNIKIKVKSNESFLNSLSSLDNKIIIIFHFYLANSLLFSQIYFIVVVVNTIVSHKNNFFLKNNFFSENNFFFHFEIYKL